MSSLHSGTEAGGERVWALKDPFWVFSEHCFKSYFIRSRSQPGIFFPFPSALSALLAMAVASASPFAQVACSLLPSPALASLPFPASGNPRLLSLALVPNSRCGYWMASWKSLHSIDRHMHVCACKCTYVCLWVCVQVYMCVCVLVHVCIYACMCSCVCLHLSVCEY